MRSSHCARQAGPKGSHAAGASLAPRFRSAGCTSAFGDAKSTHGKGLAQPVAFSSQAGETSGMSEKPMVLVAAAALVDADGRVLICQRPQGKQLAGLWEFP